MSYAQPSPPTIQTLLRTRKSAIFSSHRASNDGMPASFFRSSTTRSRWAAMPASVVWSAPMIASTRPSPIWAAILRSSSCPCSWFLSIASR